MNPEWHYEKIGTEQLLELMKNKYGADYYQAAILIYDDGSGRIVKDAIKDNYDKSNEAFSFHSVDELIEHLES